jgi:hypothetical protein
MMLLFMGRPNGADESRAALLQALAVATRYDDRREFKTGVLQV